QVAKRSDQLQSFLYQEPLPRLRTWLPLLDWLLPRLDILPGSVRPEVVETLLVWQAGTLTGAAHRREIAEQAPRWLTSSESWASREDFGYFDEELEAAVEDEGN